MSAEVSVHTLDRGIKSILSKHSLTDGANYLENHEIKDWLLWILTFGCYNKKAEKEIEIKKQILGEHFSDLTETIINADKDERGNYETSIKIQNMEIGDHVSVRYHFYNPLQRNV